MHALEQLRSGALAGTRRLDLACGLRTLPPEVFDPSDTLKVLNLSGNQLESLPHDLPRLHRLKVVFCSDNAFTPLPEVLGDCAARPPALRWLILTDNAITHLTPNLGQRPALQKLMLAGNPLGWHRLHSAPICAVPWQNLRVDKLLGQAHRATFIGRSGWAARPDWRSNCSKAP